MLTSSRMKDRRKLLSFRCDDGTYKTLLKMSEKNNMSLTILLNQAMLMYCDAFEGLYPDDEDDDTQADRYSAEDEPEYEEG